MKTLFCLSDEAISVLKTPRVKLKIMSALEIFDPRTIDKHIKNNFPNSSRDLGELKYTLQGPTGARSFKANLEVYHPGFKSKLLGLVSSTMNNELVILARLNNGDIHMLGDKDRGVEYGDSAELSSGKAVTDNNGGTLNFVYDTPTAQIYVGTNLDTIISI